MALLSWTTNSLEIFLSFSEERPVTLQSLAPRGADSMISAGQYLVELFTATEQRARTSQGYVRSAVGERLRYRAHEESMCDGAHVFALTQRDDVSGLEVETRLRALGDASAVSIEHTITNTSSTPSTLTAVATLAVGIGTTEGSIDDLDLLWGESEWLAEGRWHEQPLRTVVPRLGLDIHGQDGRGRFAITSHGAWSTGEYLPTGVLSNRTSGAALAWDIETSAGWHWELTQGLTGLHLSALGPTDDEHHFAHLLASGENFVSVPATLAVSAHGRDGAISALTDARRARRHLRPVDQTLPVIYNDFMNTLMGDPTTEKLLPLIAAAADAGVEYFCIDAGWFADDSAWWDSVGEWREAPGRFTGGLRAVITAIHNHGMKSGLWLEPEVIGVNSPLAEVLPAEAFFVRHGERVVEDHRFHLDFRHPAAREHLDRTVDHLVARYGISMLKLDYNINPGAGTDTDATAPGDGLLGHTRAFRDWVMALYERHPSLIVENCSSGAMRMDQSLLSVTHLQSTSDQQNYELYPPIAASAPVMMAAEQCGNWAYPSASMSQEETAFALASGITGRLYLAGFLHELSASQQELVREAVTLHKQWRQILARSSGRWPLGLPGWDDKVIALEMTSTDRAMIVVWSRADEPVDVVFPYAQMNQIFPRAASSWPQTPDSTTGTRLSIPEGYCARIYEVRR